MRDYLDGTSFKLRADERSQTTGAPNLRRQGIIALGFILITLVILVLDYRGYLAPVRGAAAQVLSPLTTHLSGVRAGVASAWSGIADIAEVQRLREENEALRQENSQLKEEAIAYELALVENNHLRQRLAIEERNPWRLLGAEVMVRSPDAGRRIITIGRGAKEGIEVGMAVIGQTDSSPAALVGIVEEVGADTASVLLITDFGSQVSARVVHDGTSALGLVQGQWQQGSRLRLEQLERDFALVPGSIVMSAGLSSELDLPLPLHSVPPDIPIGVVEAVQGDEHVHTAELRPYVDPDQVKYVWVVLSEQQ